MFNKKTVVFTLIMFLLAGNIFWALDFIIVKRELKDLRARVSSQQQSSKSLLFLQSLVEQVVNAETEVNFETRLKLENDVRELKDEKILAQWQLFVDSPTESAAQINVKKLLDLLVDKAIADQEKSVNGR